VNFQSKKPAGFKPAGFFNNPAMTYSRVKRNRTVAFGSASLFDVQAGSQWRDSYAMLKKNITLENESK
jgi:hypothetical protein